MSQPIFRDLGLLQAAQVAYLGAHSLCPECRSPRHVSSGTSLVMDPRGQLVDRNAFRCLDCGRVGTGHDLTPRPGVKLPRET